MFRACKNARRSRLAAKVERYQMWLANRIDRTAKEDTLISFNQSQRSLGNSPHISDREKEKFYLSGFRCREITFFNCLGEGNYPESFYDPTQLKRDSQFWKELTDKRGKKVFVTSKEIAIFVPSVNVTSKQKSPVIIPKDENPDKVYTRSRNRGKYICKRQRNNYFPNHRAIGMMMAENLIHPSERGGNVRWQ